MVISRAACFVDGGFDQQTKLTIDRAAPPVDCGLPDCQTHAGFSQTWVELFGGERTAAQRTRAGNCCATLNEPSNRPRIPTTLQNKKNARSDGSSTLEEGN